MDFAHNCEDTEQLTMLNINLGKNRELMKKCRTLREYCMFVERIRGYAKELEIAEAVERTVTECIREDILADFLSAQRAEVIAMSIFEYNKEEEMKKIRADEFRIGKAEGKAEGEARLSALINRLFLEGRSDEVQRVVTDVKWRQKLYGEYNL